MRITYHVASLTGRAVPHSQLRHQTIAEHFARGSAAGGAPAIELTERVAASSEFGGVRTGPVGAALLHEVTKAVTGNSTTPGALANVAVIYADEYAGYRDVLGVMFDRGFAAADAPVFDPVYREGCAIFLETIERARRTQGTADVEAVYTTIHEMGHLFNLTHARAGESFMAPSEASAVHPEGYYGFTDFQHGWLAKCDEDPLVWPGGLAYVDHLDQGFDVLTSRKRAKTPIRIRIGLPRRPVFPFEPFELDIAVSVDRSARGPRRLPHEIDPGYGRFTVWIEGPDGTRRSYRSPRHYCSLPRHFVLHPGQHFGRDLSVFGQSGGYTFPRPGGYRVWVRLRIGREWIVSNVAELEVKPRHAADPAHALLAHPDAAHLFYYRCSRNASVERDLEAFVRAHPRSPVCAGVAYALGRAQLRPADERAAAPRALGAERGFDLLERAYGSVHLGSHARAKAGALLAERNG